MPTQGWQKNEQYQRNSQNTGQGSSIPQSNCAEMPASQVGTFPIPDVQPPSFDQGQRRFRANMALKYRSIVTTVGEKKSVDALIDSGGTHHFFHSKFSFKSMNP